MYSREEYRCPFEYVFFWSDDRGATVEKYFLLEGAFLAQIAIPKSRQSEGNGNSAELDE